VAVAVVVKQIRVLLEQAVLVAVEMAVQVLMVGLELLILVAAVVAVVIQNPVFLE
jgi:hypothetical protein